MSDHQVVRFPQGCERLSCRIAGGQRPRPQVTVKVGVHHKCGAVDHGHDRVEVHHGAGGRQLDGDHGARLATGKQGAGEYLDRHRGSPLAHADQHRPVAQDVHVAALDCRGQVAKVVIAVVGGEVRSGEHGVVAVDGPAVQRFPLPGGLGHRVHRHAAVDPAGVVPLEQMVGQRRQDEVVCAQHIPLQAPGARWVQIRLDHPPTRASARSGPSRSSNSRRSGSTRFGPSISGVQTRSRMNARPSGMLNVSPRSCPK